METFSSRGIREARAARAARNMAAQYAHKTRQAGQAVGEYRAVIAEAPESASASVARVRLPEALMDSGQPNAGIEAWLEYSAAASDENEKASAYYCAGKLLAMRGEEFHPEAERLLRKVVEEYPETRYVRRARNRLALLNRRKTKRFGIVVDPLDIEDALKRGDDLVPRETVPETTDILKDQDMIDALAQ